MEAVLATLHHNLLPWLLDMRFHSRVDVMHTLMYSSIWSSVDCPLEDYFAPFTTTIEQLHCTASMPIPMCASVFPGKAYVIYCVCQDVPSCSLCDALL